MHENNPKQIPVTRSSMPPMEEYFEMLKPLWESAWLTNEGVYHKQLERELKNYLQVENLCLVTNGHMALENIIEAMELTGEIITTPFTFISTVHAIVRKGLTPVFCDINKEDYTIDVSQLETLITESTSAIFVVHPYGHVCDIDEIDRIAKKHGLKVIYDGAHTFGEKYRGKSVLSYGDASIVSFHATKVFHTIEGGAIVYKDEKLKEALKGLKNFGIRSEEKIDMVGGNAKMDEFRAAMGLCNLKYIDKELEKRRKVEAYYRSDLKEIEGIFVTPRQEDLLENGAYFPIQIDKELFGISRDELYDYLKENGILSRKYFYPIATKCECYQELFSKVRLSNAEEAAERVLCLPIYADLTEEDLERIIKAIQECKIQ